MTLETKMTIRVPEAWHRRIKAEAAFRGLSVSKMIRTAVDEWLKNNPVKEADSNGEENQ